MTKYLLSLALILIGFLIVTAQEKKGNTQNNLVQNDYSRNALTVIFINYDKDKYADYIKNAWPKIKIDDKYDNNQLDVISIKAPFEMPATQIEKDIKNIKQSLRSKAEQIDQIEKEKNPKYVSPYQSLLKFPKDDFSQFQKRKQEMEQRKQKTSEELSNEKYAHRIISKWFNKTPDGTVDLQTIFFRGQYNATDADYKTAMDSKRKDALLKDNGFNLINNSYIMVFDFGTVISFDEYNNTIKQAIKELQQIKQEYQKAEQEPIKTEIENSINSLQAKMRPDENGFFSDLKIYLFKIDFNQEAMQSFWDLFQDIPGDNTKWKIDNTKYDGLNIPLKFVAESGSPFAEVSQYNPGHQHAPKTQETKQEQFEHLVYGQFEMAKTSFTRKVDALKVRAPISESSKSFFFPNVKAKIGKKESVRLDKRFFAWEKVEGKDGQTKSKKAGVVRASNDIVDNRQITTGNTGYTKFYQVAGKKLDDGMILQERPDFNLGLVFLTAIPMGQTSYSSTVSYDGPMAFGGRLDVNISPLFGLAGGKFLSEFRIFLEVRSLAEVSDINAKTVDFFGDSMTVTLKSNTLVGFGISKDIYLTRNMKLSPFVQYNIGLYNEGNLASQVGYGLRVPLNILYPLSIVPGVTMFSPYTNTEAPTYTGLNGLYIDAALRLEF